MKKTILILLFVGGLCSFAKAQLLSPGIEIGYGGFTPPVLSGDAKSRQAFFSNGIQGQETVTSTGAFHLALYAKVWKVTIGVEGAYEDVMVKNDFQYNNNAGIVAGVIKGSSNYWSAMARMQWNYVTFPGGLKLYGGIAAGFYNVNSTLKSNTSDLTPDHTTAGNGFAYQGTLVGASLGNKVVLFVEGGYGFLGLVNGGIRFKLH